jgi:hypothetical protein
MAVLDESGLFNLHKQLVAVLDESGLFNLHKHQRNVDDLDQ